MHRFVLQTKISDCQKTVPILRFNYVRKHRIFETPPSEAEQKAPTFNITSPLCLRRLSPISPDCRGHNSTDIIPGQKTHSRTDLLSSNNCPYCPTRTWQVVVFARPQFYELRSVSEREGPS